MSHNQTITYRQLDALLEGRDQGTQHAIDQAVHAINFSEESIRSYAATIRGRLDRIEEHLDGVLRMNELGELQSVPMSLDMAIAKRAQAWDTLAALLPKEQTDKLIAEAKARRETAKAGA